MRLSYSQFAATHCNKYARLTDTGEVANATSLQQAAQRFNQNFEFGKFAIFEKTRPVKIINAITRELLVVQFYDRLDTPRAMVWAGSVDTLEPYKYKRRPQPASTNNTVKMVENIFTPSLPEPIADEWW